MEHQSNNSNEPFKVSGWSTNPCGEISISTPEPCQLNGIFKKKRGRPKMKEKFFYDPYETKGDIIVGIDPGGVQVGDIITVGITDSKSGYVTNIIDNNTVEINWNITYKE
jgi:hypothetical protein